MGEQKSFKYEESRFHVMEDWQRGRWCVIELYSNTVYAVCNTKEAANAAKRLLEM